MYLKHLENSRGYTVSDPRNGAYFWASEAMVIAFLKDGRIRPQGTKKCVTALHWFGVLLTPADNAQETAGYKPSESRPTRYSHNHETETNPEKVWTLIYLPGSTASIFLAVARSCHAQISRGATRKLHRAVNPVRHETNERSNPCPSNTPAPSFIPIRPTVRSPILIRSSTTPN